MANPASPVKIISDHPLIGKYICPSDGKIYEVTHLEKKADFIVCGKGVNTKTGKGIIRMNLTEFERQLIRRVFIRK